MKSIYVVSMKRWGSDATHNYVLGAYSTQEDAEFAGKVETSWRGGKYAAYIDTVILDMPTPAEEIKHYYDCLPGDVNCD